MALAGRRRRTRGDLLDLRRRRALVLFHHDQCFAFLADYVRAAELRNRSLAAVALRGANAHSPQAFGDFPDQRKRRVHGQNAAGFVEVQLPHELRVASL